GIQCNTHGRDARDTTNMLDLLQKIPPWVYIAIIMHFAVLGTVAYLILLERKVASWTQDRIGPNRVGPWGLFQPLADGLKFILKEDYQPKNVDRRHPLGRRQAHDKAPERSRRDRPQHRRPKGPPRLGARRKRPRSRAHPSR